MISAERERVVKRRARGSCHGTLPAPVLPGVRETAYLKHLVFVVR